MALGVSILLQSIERFVEPTELTNPVLVMSVGAAGVGSNILMLLVLGGGSIRTCFYLRRERERSVCRD